MGSTDAPLTGKYDYPWLNTLDEALDMCVYHIELARDGTYESEIYIHMRMASRALRLALDLFEERVSARKED